MPSINFNGNVPSAIALNASPTCSLSKDGTANGIISSVTAYLQFSTSAYSNTYYVTARLNYSGGSVSASANVKMDSSNYSGGVFQFYFSGLSADIVNAITSVTCTCSANADKIYLKNTQVVIVNYTTPTAVSAPSNASLGSVTTTDSTDTLTWSGASSGTANSIVGYMIEYCDSTNGSSYGSWQTYRLVSSSYTSGSLTVNLPEPRNYRKFRIQTYGSAGSNYYSSYKETAAVLRTSAPSAPGNVTASPAIWESGNVVIKWNASSISTGTITRYYIQYRHKTYGGSFGSWIALANMTTTEYTYLPTLKVGESIQYRVYALSSDNIMSGYGSSNTVSMEAEKPKNLMPSAGWYTTIATCSWTVPADCKYSKYRYTINSGASWSTWITLPNGVTSFSASAYFENVDTNAFFRYEVVGVAANGDQTDSTLSGELYKNIAPVMPELLAPVLTDSTALAYGGAYAVFFITGDANGHAMTLQRRINGGDWLDARTGIVGDAYAAVRLTTNALHTFRVMDEYGAFSDVLSFTLFVLPSVYTDNPIVAGTTPIKAVHINEMRDRVDHLTAMYGIPLPTWDETIVAGSTSTRNYPEHITEIRTHVTRVVNELNRLADSIVVTVPAWSAALTDVHPRGTAISELRTIINRL